MREIEEEYFNFDLDRMKEAMKGKARTIPKGIKTVEELNEWLDKEDD